MLMKNKIGGWLALILLCMEILLGLVSWILTAAMPEQFLRSLLSAEGIRWFFGNFVENINSPVLVWLLLLALAYGALRNSGLLAFDRSEYRQRIALRLVLAEFVLFVLLMLALTIIPHAILLNVMGGLWDSSFSRSILPYVCFSVIVMGVSFGVMSDKLKGVDDVFRALYSGIGQAAPFFLIYLLAVQLYCSIKYLFWY